MGILGMSMMDNSMYNTGRKYNNEDLDTTNYKGNIRIKVSKKPRKGAGKKKLSKKERKQQNIKK